MHRVSCLLAWSGKNVRSKVKNQFKINSRIFSFLPLNFYSQPPTRTTKTHMRYGTWYVPKEFSPFYFLSVIVGTMICFICFRVVCWRRVYIIDDTSSGQKINTRKLETWGVKIVCKFMRFCGKNVEISIIYSVSVPL